MSVYDDFDPDLIPSVRPVKNRRGQDDRRKSRRDDTRMRRGRLTYEERQQLARLRAEPQPQPLPENADRWSTWDSGQRGPRPYPEWLVTELAAVDHELGVLRTGKEADIHLLQRSVPDGDSCLIAAKRYRDRDHWQFHRDGGYLEGRKMRRSRENRAMARRSSFGLGMIAQQWAVAEFDILCALWSVGAPVPYPVQRVGTEVLLEFIGTPEGQAAPRLANVRVESDTVDDLWSQLVDALLTLAEQGFAHGDLSAYNVLVQPEADGTGTLVLIDLPQAVDIAANPMGVAYLRRDVHNITSWFHAQGMNSGKADPEELFEMLAEAANVP